MHVHDAAGEAADEGGREQLHEAREHHKLRAALLEPVAERLVAQHAVGLVGQREDRRLHPRGLGPLEAARLRPARRHAHDLDAVLPVDRVEQRLQVRPLTRDEDCDREAHAATRSTG